MADDTNHADDWTEDDIRHARKRLDSKTLHQLHVYITHVGQLRGVFDTAFALVRDYGIPDDELKLWSAVDMDLSSMWGPANLSRGHPLGRVGKLDGEELLKELEQLVGSLEGRQEEYRGSLLAAPPVDDDEMEQAVARVAELNSALAFLGQMTLCLNRVVKQMNGGHTSADDESEDAA